MKRPKEVKKKKKKKVVNSYCPAPTALISDELEEGTRGQAVGLVSGVSSEVRGSCIPGDRRRGRANAGSEIP